MVVVVCLFPERSLHGECVVAAPRPPLLLGHLLLSLSELSLFLNQLLCQVLHLLMQCPSLFAALILLTPLALVILLDESDDLVRHVF